MDDKDRQLLILLQKEIPLKPRPFEVLGRTAGLECADVLLRINRLQEQKVISRLRAVFDAEKAGYRNIVAAAHVLPEFRDQAAAVICGHPGVIQCVGRSGYFNLWFLLVLPVEEAAEHHLARLEEISGCQQLVRLQTLKRYKPSVKKQPEPPQGQQAYKELIAPEKRLMEHLQEDFPVTDEPFQRLGKELGFSEDWVLQRLQKFQKSGLLKKISAPVILFTKNIPEILTLWNIPEEKMDWAAEQIGAFPKVHFCAKRSASPELPFALHALYTGEDHEAWLKQVESQIGLWPRQISLKEKEYKKIRFKYFSKDIEAWRIQNEIPAASSFSND